MLGLTCLILFQSVASAQNEQTSDYGIPQVKKINEEIRQQCPDIELEVFVHGALCIAYSGRCLLSGYFNHRDENQVHEVYHLLPGG